MAKKTRTLLRADPEFWDATELEELRSFICRLKVLSEASPRTLIARMQQVGLNDVPSEPTLKRFLAGKSPLARTAWKDSLTLYCETVFESNSRKNDLPFFGKNSEKWTKFYKRFYKQRGAFLDDLVEQVDEELDSAYAVPKRFFDLLSIAYDIAPGLIRVRSEEFDDLADYMFGKVDKQTRYFATYRYSRKVGYVVRSLTTLFPPRPHTKFILGSNQLSFDETERKSRGLIMPAHHAFYFIGRMEGGVGFKVGVFKWGVRHKPTNFYGLLSSFTAENDPLAARVALRGISKKAAMTLVCGRFKEGELAKEISPFKGQLRNYVPFRLNEKILLDGKPISNDAMVAEIERLLRDKSGNPRLTTASGDAFNPADTESYPYNSVLRFPRGR